MNPDISSLAAILKGYRNGRERLEELRTLEIRSSDIREQLATFDGLFEHALATGIEREVAPLSKAMRIYLGVDR